ncbi:hypothetical protein POTOM_022113 [Populus tomentosa]|uniref:Uncharacterized protein n=1 Tax=Populus tomentosa TaxID=118781 RepID=A0A8X8D1I9_POPTO|nr:hypothetical protein POTOM_022113 [Populus tomentosa]
MSRCFPYLPPGYLTESIKLQGESFEKGKHEGRKRGGGRKKEGSMGKVTVRKEVVLVISSIERTKGSFQRKEEKKMKRAILLRKISNLCPLRAFATCPMVAKLMVSLWVLDFGTIIRIQLPLRWHREHTAPVNGAGLCSSLGTADSVPQKNKIVETSLRSYDKETRTAESLYQDLIANLEESFQFELNNLVDQEWLFGTTKQDRHGYKRLKVCHDVSCHADSTTRLRAQYVPEADVYGLPYTIPF